MKLPQAEAREIAFLTLPEANKLLGTTRETEWGPLLHLAVALGMRQGELFGLVWSKVHLDDADPHLDVHQQLTGTVIGPVKTKASKRKLYLDAGSIRHLERIRAEQADRPNPHDLVFPSKPKPPEPPKGEPRRVLAPAELPALQFLSRDNVTGRVLPTLQDRAKVSRTTFHGLRQTGASLLSSQGVAESTIDRWMGHKSGSISMRYIHAYDDDVKNCAHVMSTILEPAWQITGQTSAT